MRLLHLELVNFCQHRHFSQELSPGLTGVLGANGSGKSNFLGGISFALTGENPNAGRKEDNICQTAPAAERSYVQLRFSHGSVTATVTRYLRPASVPTLLHVEGEQVPVRGDRAVNARISAILGGAASLLNNIVLVRQDDIFGFLAQTSGKRLEAFQKLFRLERAAAVHKLLGERLRTLELAAPVADKAAWLERQQTLRAEEGRLLEALPALGDAATIKQRLAAARACVVAWSHVRECQRLIHDASGRASAAERKLGGAQLAVTELAAAVAILQPLVVADKVAAGVSRAMLVDWARYRQAEGAAAAVRAQLTAAQAEQLAEPEAPAWWSKLPVAVGEQLSLAPLLREAGETAAALRRARRLLESFDGSLAECPTCQTAVTTIQPRVDKARQQLPALQAAAEEAQAYVTVGQEYQAALVTYAQAKAYREQRVAGLIKAVAAVDCGAPPMLSEEAARVQLTQYEERAQGLRAHEAALGEARAGAASGQSEVAAAQAEVVRAQQRLTTYDCTEDSACTAELTITGLERQDALRASTAQELAVVRASLVEVRQSLDAVAAAELRAERLRSWAGRMEHVRTLVHKDAAPRFVSQQHLQQLETMVNEQLSHFQADYRVTAEEGLSFRGHFLDGRVQPAERFSGGQKVVLALAFRLAVNFTYARDLGLLVLDEPTAYLDAHHIQGFAPVLSELRRCAVGRGLQCIIITHEDALAPLFDSVIRLTTGEKC